MGFAAEETQEASSTIHPELETLAELDSGSETGASCSTPQDTLPWDMATP